MTLSTDPAKEIKLGNDSTTVFSFTFVINTAADISVIHTDSAGVETPVTEGTGTTNYSISVANYPGNGSVTYPATLGTELATGDKLTLARVVDLDQETDLQNQDKYKPETVESTFDYSRMIDLQQQDQIDRSIKAPISDNSGADYTLPTPTANTVIGLWNAAANAIIAGPTASEISNAQTYAVAAQTAQAGAETAETGAQTAQAGAETAETGAVAAQAAAEAAAALLPVNKFDATTAPTVNNDVDEGYTVGSTWADVTNDISYICLDNTDGAAVWERTSGVANGYVTLAKMADLAQDQFIGRTTASTGVPQTATITAAARTVLDDTTVTAMRATLAAAALSVTQTFTGAQKGTVTALTSTAASIAVDAAVNNYFSHTMTEDTTLAAPSNGAAGQAGQIAFTQHASSAKTLALNAAWVEITGATPVMSTTVDAVNLLSYYSVDGSTFFYSFNTGGVA